MEPPGNDEANGDVESLFHHYYHSSVVMMLEYLDGKEAVMLYHRKGVGIEFPWMLVPRNDSGSLCREGVISVWHHHHSFHTNSGKQESYK